MNFDNLSFTSTSRWPIEYCHITPLGKLMEEDEEELFAPEDVSSKSLIEWNPPVGCYGLRSEADTSPSLAAQR